MPCEAGFSVKTEGFSAVLSELIVKSKMLLSWIPSYTINKVFSYVDQGSGTMQDPSTIF